MKGQCACSLVKYEIDIPKPLGVGNCHCSTCRKHSGAPYVTAMFVPVQAMQVSGHYVTYPTRAASGNIMNRSFCNRCGTPLFGQSTGTDKIRPVLISSLDQEYREDLKPAFDFWTCEALMGTPMDISTPTYTTQFTRLHS